MDKKIILTSFLIHSIRTDDEASNKTERREYVADSLAIRSRMH